jgi:hypothetical protein
MFHCLHFRSGPAEQYVIIVWGETFKVGCGYLGYFYPEYDFDVRTYVCLYGPGGAIEGDKVYQIGAACSACPAGTTCDDGLCAWAAGRKFTDI